MANNKEAKTVKENNKNKKSFFKGFKAELKKVVWPTPKQLVNNTVAVITIVLITSVIVFVLDLAFESVNKHGIDKIKEIITASNTISEEDASISEENTTSDEKDADAETDNEQDYESEGRNEQTEPTLENTETNSDGTNTENNAQ